MSRHGQRYPDEDDIIDINKYLPELQSTLTNSTLLCEEDRNEFLKWITRLKPEMDNLLTLNGKNFIFEFGKRMRERLSSLVGSLETSQVKVLTTERIRTKESAEEFVRGFLPDLKLNIETAPEFLLKFPDVCDKYKKVNLFLILHFRVFSHSQKRFLHKRKSVKHLSAGITKNLEKL